MFTKHRLEALSDGIFAIAMTLLVLDLKVPEGALPPHFARLLTQEWIGVIITFMIAAIYWTLQHRIFELFPHVHDRAIVPTFLFLGLISVLPFSTGYFSGHILWRSAYVVYFSHAGLIGAALLLKLEVLVRSSAAAADPLKLAMLRMRLATLCVIMATLALSAGLLPFQYISTATVLAAIGVQLFTRKRKAALKAQYGPVLKSATIAD